jgi:NosR/NirI family transcriptional regulator, nitrous oxide reductase regulator
MNFFMKKLFMLMLLLMASIISVEAQDIVEKGETLATKSDVVKEFPTAKSVSKISGGVYDVLGSEHESIGKIVLSSFYSSGITGFAGPTPLLIAVNNDGTIKDVTLLANDETPNFVAKVRNAGLFAAWNGMKFKDAANKEVDAVTGATYTSTAVIRSMKATIANAVIPESKVSPKSVSVKKK